MTTWGAQVDTEGIGLLLKVTDLVHLIFGQFFLQNYYSLPVQLRRDRAHSTALKKSNCCSGM